MKQRFIIVALAKADGVISVMENEAVQKTRLSFIELSRLAECEFGETRLDRLGDLVLDGKPEHFDLLLTYTGRRNVSY